MKISILAAFVVALFVSVGCSSQPTPAQVSLHEAALTGNLEAVKRHVAGGADLNIKDDFGSTPLIVAATFGKTDVAKALLDAGADLHVGNNEGSTPLHVASFLCYPDMVDALLDAGADVSATNNNGHTPLETVSGPFESVRPVYDAIGGALSAFGLQLDYERIRTVRPQIAETLRSRMADAAGASADAPSEG